MERSIRLFSVLVMIFLYGSVVHGQTAVVGEEETLKGLKKCTCGG